MISIDDLNGVSTRRVNVSMSMPMSLLNVIDRIADSEQQPVAKVMARVLRKGLEVERAEREAKQATASAAV